jgi:uncharacterized protein
MPLRGRASLNQGIRAVFARPWAPARLHSPQANVKETIAKMQPAHTSLIIVQPTPFCNIDCSYCYLPSRNDRTRLEADQIGTIFKKLLTFPSVQEQVSVVWHAGEPLVPGIAYYEKVFAEIEKAARGGLQINHAMQTNGTLINDAWCDFFKRWNVGLGVSIDGPMAIHDACRKTRSGQGTFKKTVEGIARLRANEIPFYVISVLTKVALLQPDAMFDFYQAFDIRDVGFNIEEKEGMNETSSLEGLDDEARLVAFFTRFSELMVEREFPIAVRELEEALASIQMLDVTGPSSHQNEPFGIITIDVTGNVYTFSPELAGFTAERYGSLSIGNIFEASYEELRDSAKLALMTAEIKAGIERCRRECSYFRVCGGGTPSNKLFENGSFASTETKFCRLTKQRVTDFVLRSIESRLRP